MKKNTINKCPKCGSTSIYVSESTGYQGSIDDDGTIYLKNVDNQIDSIACHGCGHDLSFIENELNFD